MDSEAFRAYSAAWSPDIPSLVIGILLGVAACLLGLKVAHFAEVKGDDLC